MMKSERVRLLQILVCVCLFCASLCSSADVENIATKIGVDGTALEHMETPVKFRYPETSVSYAVSMTTIPARIPHLRHVVESWLTQRGGPPRYIFIFVPKVYKRFKRKGSAGTGQSFKCMAEGILVDQLESMSGDAAVFKDCPTFIGEEPALRDNANDSGIFTTIRTVEVDHDWGPATKYVGLMDYRLHWEDKWEVDTREPPDYWVVSDDDVRYLSNTWSLYDAFISNDAIVAEREHEAQGQESRTAPVGPATMLTHFSEDYRQLLHLEQEDFTRPVLHLQGVDTVAFPSRILQMHEEDLCAAAPGGRVLPCSLSSARVQRGLRFLHEQCPASFYQDDYVISLLVNLGNVDVRSTYLVGRNNVARHVDGMSKHFNQMHMSDKVGLREEQTKRCLKENVEQLLQAMDEIVR